MKKYKLCITIPTYNRNEMLNKTITALLEQLREDCQILILDNGSEEPVVESLAPLLELYPNASILIQRNKFNIGANANIVKCFEQTSAEWMWLLSDDDDVSPDAISSIYRAIDDEPDCIYFNFSLLGRGRRISVMTQGLTRFIESIDYYDDLNLISTNVYRCDRLKSHLQHCYRFMYCCAPHLVMVILALGSDGVACLRKDSIVIGNAVNPKNVGWSWLPFALSRMTILDLPLTGHQRKALARQIIRGRSILWHITMLLILQAYLYRKGAESRYLYDQICYRYFYFSSWFTRNVVIRLTRLLIVFPSMGYTFLRLFKSKDALKALVNDELLLRI